MKIYIAKQNKGQEYIAGVNHPSRPERLRENRVAHSPLRLGRWACPRYAFLALLHRLLLLSFLCSLAVQAYGQSTTSAIQPVDTSLRLRGTDGRTYDLASMRGQVVLVSFGATWCEPCKEELKELEQLKREYKDKPVQFLWVSVDGEQDVSNSQLKDYAKRLKISFPVLRDPDRSTFMRFSPRMRLPTILFFGRDGKLSMPNQVGVADARLYLSTIRGRLDKLLIE